MELIDDNSGEALGNSRPELEEVVARLRAALRRGYPDEAGVQEVLASAYHSLWSRAPGTREEGLAFRAAEADAYRRLRELQPRKPEWDIAYVDALSDRTEQMKALEEVVRRRPAYAPAWALLGVLSCDAGRKREGLSQLERAARAYSRKDDVDSHLEAMIVNGAAECAGMDEAKRIQAIVRRPTPP
jgi:hypothetical protein